MYNLGVHWIDLFRYILEDEVEEASGRNVKVNTKYSIEDNSFAHLKFRKGAVAALDISYTVPDSFPHGRDLYLAFRGTRGVVTWSPAYEGESDVLFVCSDAPEFAGAPQRRIAVDIEKTPGYSGWMGRTYVRSFVDAVRSGKALRVTGEDGVAALKTVEAVYKAAETKKWVKVK
jgi:predicted dehydrogenase